MANVGCRQRFVEGREGAIESPARASASASQSSRARRRQNVLLAQKSTPRRMSSSRSPGALASTVARPSRNTPNAAHIGRSCSRARLGEFDGVRRDARQVAAHQIKQGRVHLPARACRHGRPARSAPPGAANERSRALDIAQRPQDKREIEHRGDAGVRSKAKGQIVVAARLEQGECALQVIARFTYRRRTSSGSERAMCDTGLR